MRLIFGGLVEGAAQPGMQRSEQVVEHAVVPVEESSTVGRPGGAPSSAKGGGAAPI
jgi:hypothetical protein